MMSTRPENSSLSRSSCSASMREMPPATKTIKRCASVPSERVPSPAPAPPDASVRSPDPFRFSRFAIVASPTASSPSMVLFSAPCCSMRRKTPPTRGLVGFAALRSPSLRRTDTPTRLVLPDPPSDWMRSWIWKPSGGTLTKGKLCSGSSPLSVACAIDFARLWYRPRMSRICWELFVFSFTCCATLSEKPSSPSWSLRARLSLQAELKARSSFSMRSSASSAAVKSRWRVATSLRCS
mmetsp:Transcript_2043/g.9008  ORF Transcript_2043/g.9008 Transcript_2043/m.9008 type:complete len:238 (+) Transcript_2043:200-913(+)